MERVPEPRLEPREPKVAHQCSWCDGEIYDGETAYNLEPYGWCCESCITLRREIAEA